MPASLPHYQGLTLRPHLIPRVVIDDQLIQRKLTAAERWAGVKDAGPPLNRRWSGLFRRAIRIDPFLSGVALITVISR